jgi:hypothetical protein
VSAVAFVAAFVFTGLTVSDLADHGAVGTGRMVAAVVSWLVFAIAFMRMP